MMKTVQPQAGSYYFYKYRNRIRAHFSDEGNCTGLMFFDITNKMFQAVKSPCVTTTFWNWARGQPVRYGGKVLPGSRRHECRIYTDVEHHELYFHFHQVELVEFLPNIHDLIINRMDVTSFGRLLKIETIDSLPDWTMYNDTPGSLRDQEMSAVGQESRGQQARTRRELRAAAVDRAVRNRAAGIAPEGGPITRARAAELARRANSSNN